jgi:hypothetical protein
MDSDKKRSPMNSGSRNLEKIFGVMNRKTLRTWKKILNGTRRPEGVEKKIKKLKTNTMGLEKMYKPMKEGLDDFETFSNKRRGLRNIE